MKFPQYWKVEPVWAGEPCAILASGPSMSQQVADAVRRLRTVVVNNTFRLAPWADILYAADSRWWHAAVNKDLVTFQGKRVSVHAIGEELPGNDVALLRWTGKEGFDAEPGCVRTGYNSGYQALHLAVQLGAAPILLCGFDMHSIRNRQHWHDKHEYPLRDHGDGIYAQWIKSFEDLAPILEARGVKVINVTPGSALKCFPAMKLEEALASLLHDKASASVS